MRKLLKFIREHKMLILVGIIIFLFADSLLQRSCNGRKIAELKGQLQVSESEREEGKKGTEKLIKEKDENTAKLEEEIQELKVESAKIDEDRVELIATDREKADEIYMLKEQAKYLTDPNSIADNWRVQAETWEERFWNERKDKELILTQRNQWATAYFKAENKYWNEHAIRSSLEKQLARTERSLEISDKLNVRYEKRIGGIKLKMTVKNVLYTGIGFLAGVIVE